MSAPIAVSATAGSTILLFTSSTSKPLLAAVLAGMWGKASISPLSGWLGRRGKRNRSAKPIVPCPQAFFVNLPRRAIAEALVLALLIVEIEPGTNTGFGLGHTRIDIEVDLLVFEASPQPLDKDVVHAPAITVHAYGDPGILQRAGEIVAGELTAPRFREGRLWSVLKISGRPYRESVSTQKSAPSVFDSRHASTARLTQSMTTTR
jgi:hypothetical protein